MKNKLPYSAPQGYFEDLQQRLSAIPETKAVRRSWARPIAAVAAASAMLIVAGSLIFSGIGKSTVQEQYSYEDEIVDYLINSGTSLEQLAYYVTE